MSGNERLCPTCGAVVTQKDGADRRSGQRFRCVGCRRCRRRFMATTGTPIAGYRFPSDIIGLAVRWHLRYRLRYAAVAELLANLI